jgi:hypothetical protein
LSRPSEQTATAADAVRFVVACPDRGLEGWQARCIEELRALGHSLEAVVAVSKGTDGSPLPFLYRLWRQRAARAPALRNVPQEQIAPNVQRVEARLSGRPRRRELALSGSRDPTVLGAGIEFALSFGLPPLQGPLAALPRRGVWAFDFDLDGRGGAALHGMAAVLEGETITEARLLQLDSDGSPTAVLARGRFGTDPRSPARTAVRPLDAIVSWPPRACRSTTRPGALPSPGPHATSDSDTTVERRTRSTPSDLRMLGLGARVLAARLSFAWGRLFRHPQWNIGLVDRPIESFLREDGAGRSVQWYPLEGRRSFLADPFGVVGGEDAGVLCERFDYEAEEGQICFLRADGDAFRSRPRPVLETPGHASYPYVFREGSDIYCVPETCSAGEAALYRASDFPDEWERVGRLLPDVAAVDPTLFRRDGRWWLACTEDGPFRDTRLLIFHAGKLEGPWTPHTANPVKTDVRTARPGGAPFEHEGDLYRPAQDCSRTYGGAVVVNRVDRLTPETFREEPVATVEPEPGSPYPAGRHTLSALGDQTLIDGHRFVFAPAAFRSFLRIWARDLLGDDDRSGTSPASDRTGPVDRAQARATEGVTE